MLPINHLLALSESLSEGQNFRLPSPGATNRERRKIHELYCPPKNTGSPEALSTMEAYAESVGASLVCA